MKPVRTCCHCLCWWLYQLPCLSDIPRIQASVLFQEACSEWNHKGKIGSLPVRGELFTSLRSQQPDIDRNVISSDLYSVLTTSWLVGVAIHVWPLCLCLLPLGNDQRHPVTRVSTGLSMHITGDADLALEHKVLSTGKPQKDEEPLHHLLRNSIIFDVSLWGLRALGLSQYRNSVALMLENNVCTTFFFWFLLAEFVVIQVKFFLMFLIPVVFCVLNICPSGHWTFLWC